MASIRSLGTLTIDLIAKTFGFEQGMDRSARNAKKRMKELEDTAKSLGTAVGTVGAVLATGFAVVVRNTIQAEQQISQLDAILKSTGNAAGYTREQLVSMANEFQKSSTFGAGEIIEAETRLLSYSGILGKNIPRAMQTIIDQSARLNISLTQSAETIGRALESPSKAAAALAQQGFGAAFTDNVKRTIDALVRAGREGEAQIMILEILEESYGGAALAARNTFGGALLALKNTLSDLMTGSDGSLNGLTKSLNDLNDTLNDPQVRSGFETLINGAIKGAGAFAELTGKITEAIGEYRKWLADAGRLPADMLDSEAQIDARIRGLSRMKYGTDLISQIQRTFLGGSIDEELAKAISQRRGFQFRDVTSRVLPGGTDNAGNTSNLDLRTDAERKKAAADAERAAERLAKAIVQMNKVQREWQTELDGTGNNILDEYARKLDEITSRGEEFARMGMPADAVAKFRGEMERLAGAIRDKQLSDFGREFNWSTQELKLNLAGISTASVQYERDLYSLNEQLKQNLISQDQYNERLSALEGKRFSEQDSARNDLEFELKLLQMTNAERQASIVMRGWDVESVKKYGATVREEVQRLQDALKQANVMDDFRSSFTSFFEDVISGTRSLKDAFKSMLDNIAQMITQRIAQNWVDQLFGEMGSTGSGSAGGNWFGQIAKWITGGRANGGWTSAHSVYEVNERGLEMATVRGRDFLLTGGSPVEVTPNHRLSFGGGSGSVTQNFYNPVMSNLQTDSQRAREEARKAQKATARNS